MANYKFEQFKTEIVDPIITINPVIRQVNPIDLTIDVSVTLTTPNGSKFGVDLENVKVLNLEYDGVTLMERVMSALSVYSIKSSSTRQSVGFSPEMPGVKKVKKLSLIARIIAKIRSFISGK